MLVVDNGIILGAPQMSQYFPLGVDADGLLGVGSEAAGMWLQALALFQQAMEDGHFKQQRWDASGAQRAEVRPSAAQHSSHCANPSYWPQPPSPALVHIPMWRLVRLYLPLC